MKISSLKGTAPFLEIVFVGFCEVFICQEFAPYFPLVILSVKLIGPFPGDQFFKNADLFP